uniref:Uncharacterized protein n=1 Tax=Anguilla anguilla TaxID=7936 RepID=A0A0E9T9L7_ANGAN
MSCTLACCVDSIFILFFYTDTFTKTV